MTCTSSTCARPTSHCCGSPVADAALDALVARPVGNTPVAWRTAEAARSAAWCVCAPLSHFFRGRAPNIASLCPTPFTRRARRFASCRWQAGCCSCISSSAPAQAQARGKGEANRTCTPTDCISRRHWPAAACAQPKKKKAGKARTGGKKGKKSGKKADAPEKTGPPEQTLCQMTCNAPDYHIPICPNHPDRPKSRFPYGASLQSLEKWAPTEVDVVFTPPSARKGLPAS